MISYIYIYRINFSINKYILWTFYAVGIALTLDKESIDVNDVLLFLQDKNNLNAVVISEKVTEYFSTAAILEKVTKYLN